MKFKAEKESLERAMQKINAIVPTRDAQTLLSNVLLDVNKNQLGITASDMESTVRISLPINEAEEDGEIIVKAKTFADIASKIKSEEIHFSAAKNNEVSTEENIVYDIKVLGNEKSAASYSITGNHRSHFPGVSAISDTNLSPLPQEILQEMISKTIYSISQDNNRFIFEGLCFIAEGNKLTLLGTDGRRMAIISRNMPEPISLGNGEVDIAVHSKAITELLKILDYSADVKIGVEQRNIFFRVGNADLSSRLLEGKFPDFKKVIPESCNVSFELDRSVLLDALQQVSIMTEPPSYQVRFVMSQGKVVLLAKTPDKGNAEIELGIEYNFTPITIGFNANYLGDIIKNLSCQKVKLEFNDSTKPIVVRDMEDKDFIALVMPMNIGN